MSDEESEEEDENFIGNDAEPTENVERRKYQERVRERYYNLASFIQRCYGGDTK